MEFNSIFNNIPIKTQQELSTSCFQSLPFIQLNINPSLPLNEIWQAAGSDIYLEDDIVKTRQPVDAKRLPDDGGSDLI